MPCPSRRPARRIASSAPILARSAVATTLIAWGALPAAAQECGDLSPKQHTLLSGHYAATQMTSMDSTWGEVWRTEVGGTLGVTVNPLGLLDKKTRGVLSGGYAYGRTDYRSEPSGLLDRSYHRAYGRFSVEQDIPLVKGLKVCASIGGSGTLNEDDHFPMLWVSVPVTGTVAYTYSIAGITATAWLSPTAAYFWSRSSYTGLGGTWQNIDAGRDIQAAAGATVRMGRIAVSGSVRALDHELQNNLQMLVRTTVMY
jgi:hypothetical protein